VARVRVISALLDAKTDKRRAAGAKRWKRGCGGETFEGFAPTGPAPNETIGCSYAAAPPLRQEVGNVFEASLEHKARRWTLIVDASHYRFAHVIEAVPLANDVQQSGYWNNRATAADQNRTFRTRA
jgi:hypothetical protein